MDYITLDRIPDTDTSTRYPQTSDGTSSWASFSSWGTGIVSVCSLSTTTHMQCLIVLQSNPAFHSDPAHLNSGQPLISTFNQSRGLEQELHLMRVNNTQLEKKYLILEARHNQLM
jgi:hypothetical protein